LKMMNVSNDNAYLGETINIKKTKKTKKILTKKNYNNDSLIMMNV